MFAIPRHFAPSPITTKPDYPTWSAFDHRDTAAPAATATIAGVTNKRHVLEAFHASVTAGAAPGVVYLVNVRVFFGATQVFNDHMALPTTAASEAPPSTLAGLNLKAGFGESITIDFDSVPIANVHQSVFITGHTE